MHGHRHHDEHSSGRGRCSHHHARFGPPFGLAGHLRGGFGGHGGGRARRGDVRSAVLRLLSEQPMHGYQIIQELSARSGGAWSPSAGSVYPTLQLLADEGLVTAEETGGKKVFSLTPSGASAAADCAKEAAPWEEAAESDPGIRGYREAVGRLMQAAGQIGLGGTADQRARALEILTSARKELYAILAED